MHVADKTAQFRGIGIWQVHDFSFLYQWHFLYTCAFEVSATPSQIIWVASKPENWRGKKVTGRATISSMGSYVSASVEFNSIDTPGSVSRLTTSKHKTFVLLLRAVNQHMCNKDRGHCNTCRKSRHRHLPVIVRQTIVWSVTKMAAWKDKSLSLNLSHLIHLLKGKHGGGLT